MKFWAFQPSAQADEIDLLVYGYIAETSVWDDEVGAREFRQALDANKGARRINVRINSGGGDAFAGIAIHAMLKAHPAEVVAFVEGLAGSAASLIAMAGDRVSMAVGAMMMVHNPSALAMGEAADLRKTADVLDKVRDSLVAIYQAKTGKTAEELQTLLDAETWLTAEDAVAQGFADEIAGEPVVPQARGEAVFFNSVSFPRSAVPRAVQPVAEVPPVQDPPPPPETPEPEETEVEPEPEPDEAEDEGTAPTDPPPVALTRDLLADLAPGLLASLLAEGRALAQAERPSPTAPVALTREMVAAQAPALLASLLAEGAQAERKRIQGIEDLAIPGHSALLAQAKFGPEPMAPEAFAVALIKAERAQRGKHLSDVLADAAEATVPAASAPQDHDTEDARLARLIKVGADAGSTGTRRQ